jgi:KEOPS complex subunit Pcc1
MHSALFRIETNSALIICKAVAPEEEDEKNGLRSQGQCRMISHECLEISISAADLPALRASLNSWLRLIQVASEMIDSTQIRAGIMIEGASL